MATLALSAIGLSGWYVWKQSKGPYGNDKETIVASDLPAGSQRVGMSSTSAVSAGMGGGYDGGIGTGTTTGAGGTPLSPEQAAAEAKAREKQKRWEKLSRQSYDALMREKRVHVSIVYSALGGKKREIWKDGDKFRDETPERLSLSDGGRRWLWLPKTREAFTWKRASLVNVPAAETVDVAPELRYPYDWLSHVIKASGKIDKNYYSPDTFVIGTEKLNRYDPIRQTLTLEPETFRPIREELASRLTTTVRYGENPPAGAFRFVAPGGVKVLDLDLARAGWLAQTKKPPARTVRGGGWTMDVRDVQVGRSGDVFVLYTGDFLQSFTIQNRLVGLVKSKRVVPRDDIGREYEYLNPEISTGAAPTEISTGVAPTEFWGKQFHLAIFGTLEPAGGKRPRFLELRRESKGQVASIPLPLPAPLSTEFPSYSALLWPYARFAEARRAALARHVKRLEKESGGAVTPALVEEAERFVKEKVGTELSWELYLQLGYLQQAAGQKPEADRYFQKALETFRKDNPDSKTPLPNELARIVTRLEP